MTFPPAQPPKKHLLVSAVALVNADGEVLLAQRPAGKPMAGLWEFPGGKVEAGETPDVALCRELAEELTIAVKREDLSPLTFVSHHYPDFQLLLLLYLCRQWEGDIQAQEGQETRWISLAAMKNMPMPDADVPLVAFLEKMLTLQSCRDATIAV